MHDAAIAYFESYDEKKLRQTLVSLDILGKPIVQILDGLPSEVVELLLSVLDMVVENNIAGDLNAAYVYKKGLRSFEELYELLREEVFIVNFRKLMEKYDFYSDEEDAMPAINPDGSLSKEYKFNTHKHYTPGYEQDMKSVQDKLDIIRDYTMAMIPDRYHLRVTDCEPIWGPTPSGYEKSLDGLRLDFTFKG